MTVVIKMIESHISGLRFDLTGLYQNLSMYPIGSFGQARINLGIEICKFKIVLWEAIGDLLRRNKP